MSVFYNWIYNRRCSTDSAKAMLDYLDREAVPVLLCLTHADKLYANECLKVVGKDCPEDTATRMIGKELDVSSFLMCTIQEYCMLFRNS